MIVSTCRFLFEKAPSSMLWFPPKRGAQRLSICQNMVITPKRTGEQPWWGCLCAEYNGGLTREQFLFFEIRIVASLLSQGLSREETVARIKAENLFQFPTERMISSIAGTCFRRIEALDSDVLVYHLAHAPATAAKQINLYAMMKYNRIVWDFMTLVIAEKYRTREFDFSKKDLNVFFLRLRARDASVASWSDGTIQKIKQVLTRALVECGYLDTPRSTRLNNVTIEPELEDELRSVGDSAALPAFNCFG